MRSRSRSRSSLVVAVALLGIASGCKRRTVEAIAVVPKGTSHEFWKSVHAGAVKAARETGVEIIWKGPLREDDRQSQIDVVESFIDMRVKGLVIAPLDRRALVPVVSDAVGRRIPVVVIDSALDSDAPSSYVATDNLLGGRLAGEHLAKLLGGTGRVMMLRYVEGSASTAERETGFLQAMAKHPGISVVSATQFAGATSESALKASENLIATHRAADGTLLVKGVFCSTEPTTFAMLRALEVAGLSDGVQVVGFDSSPKMVEAMNRGRLAATVVQDPINIGYLGVKTMVQHRRGERPGNRIDTGVTLVTRESMAEPRMKELLNPAFAEWLDEK
jgi:ribose transport system substrate-binding protein